MWKKQKHAIITSKLGYSDSLGPGFAPKYLIHKIKQILTAFTSITKLLQPICALQINVHVHYIHNKQF